jgi:DNA-binding transcriptional MerR regulator
VDDLLPIGRFARVSGLSIGGLRHYDEVSLLRPAVVDRDTGYRRYRAEQVAVARLIARLRDLEVPLDEIGRILAADEVERRGLLAAHRARLEARAFRVHYLLHVLGQLSTGKEAHRDRTASPTGAGRRHSQGSWKGPLQPHLDVAREEGSDAG